MTTSLILRPAADLTETQAAMLAEMDSEGDAGFDFHPIRLKFPTGGSTGMFMLSDGDALKAPVEMIVVAAQRARAYWPSKKTLGKPPLCSAPDGVTARFDTASDQVKIALTAEVRHPALSIVDPEAAKGPWQCNGCPLADWESVGNGGRGQACKAMRKLLVVVKGWSMPAVLTLPPTSIKAWDTFASAYRQKGKAYFGTWLSVSLESSTNGDGTTYAVINVKPSAALTDGEAAEVMALRAQFVDLVRSMDLTSEDYNTDDAPPASAPSQTDEEEPPF